MKTKKPKQERGEHPQDAYKRITGIKYTGSLFQQIWCRGYAAAMSK